MGLGGGFLMTVYLANGTAVRIDQNILKRFKLCDEQQVSLIAREMAPMASSRDMYSKGRSSKYGPGASGVPGELLGYWEAKERPVSYTHLTLPTKRIV